MVAPAHSAKKLVKTPSYPFVGNLPDIARSPLKFVSNLKEKYGDVAQFSLLGDNVVLLSIPEEIERVLLETGKRYTKFDPPYALRTILGNGLVSSEGDFWKRQRKLIAPAFHHQSIKQYADIMTDYTKDLMAEWQHGGERDVHNDMMLLTQRIIMKTLFDVDVSGNAQDAGEAFDAMMHALGSQMGGIEAVLPSFIPTPSRKAMHKGVDYINAMLIELIEQRKGKPSGGKYDLLTMMMDARDDEGQPMTQTQLLDEIRTLYLAGHETTATTLSWTWHLLSQNPEVYAKLEAEVDSVLNGQLPTADDLPQLAYCNAVIKESLRCYPVAWVFQRTAAEDVELGGYHIPKGTMIWISPWVVHHDARWYPQPDSFMPERWLKEKSEQPMREAYIPFAGGPRICIGNGFAMMESVLLLATLVQRYHVSLLPNHPVEIEMTGTIRPKFGLKATITSRNS